jgi:release factor glutamine methyltransferase
VLDRAAQALALSGVPDARREARLLLGYALGLDQASLLRARDQRIDEAAFAAVLARRLAREPIALITGRVGFWTLSLATSPATLIPRPDSETVVEAALAAFPARDARRVLDLGTGTGCLLLAVLSEMPGAFGVGVDRVALAAELAARNAAEAGLADRASFLCGDWDTSLQGRFDLIVCNPPYIPSGEIGDLMPEVSRHEPMSALDGGPDGLAAYRMVIARVPRLLARGGAAVFEVGMGQADSVMALAKQAGLQSEAPRFDLGGVARAVSFRS